MTMKLSRVLEGKYEEEPIILSVRIVDDGFERAGNANGTTTMHRLARKKGQFRIRRV